jgi:hypothetical protein
VFVYNIFWCTSYSELANLRKKYPASSTISPVSRFWFCCMLKMESSNISNDDVMIYVTYLLMTQPQIYFRHKVAPTLFACRKALTGYAFLPFISAPNPFVTLTRLINGLSWLLILKNTRVNQALSMTYIKAQQREVTSQRILYTVIIRCIKLVSSAFRPSGCDFV